MPLRKHNGTKKGEKDKQIPTNIAHKTTDRVTQTALKTRGEIRMLLEGRQFSLLQ
jgi:hypothetical protein